MKILVLGGTYFIGKHLVEKLIRQDVYPTLLNRGTKNPFPELETIKADRHEKDKMKEVLKNKTFDIIIDICGYVLKDIKITLDSLDCKIKQYIFLSSAAAEYQRTQYGIDKKKLRISY